MPHPAVVEMLGPLGQKDGLAALGALIDGSRRSQTVGAGFQFHCRGLPPTRVALPDPLVANVARLFAASKAVLLT